MSGLADGPIGRSTWSLAGDSCDVCEAPARVFTSLLTRTGYVDRRRVQFCYAHSTELGQLTPPVELTGAGLGRVSRASGRHRRASKIGDRA